MISSRPERGRVFVSPAYGASEVEPVAVKLFPAFRTSDHSGAELSCLIEYGGSVTLLCKIERTGHTCGTGTDNGDLLLIGLAGLVDHGRNEARSFMHIHIGNKLLDFIDSNCLIDIASGTFYFAAVVADSSAYCREGILFLDKFKCILISAFGSKTKITLNGDVCRAGCCRGVFSDIKKREINN